jgi:hypothetical protein
VPVAVPGAQRRDVHGPQLDHGTLRGVRDRVGDLAQTSVGDLAYRGVSSRRNRISQVADW